MNNFAHNGIVHASNSEAAAHILNDVAKLLVFVVTSILITWAVYRAYRKLSYVRLDIKNRRDSK